MRLLLACVLVLVQGCTNSPIRDHGEADTKISRATQIAFIERVLTAQIYPPIDAPLVMLAGSIPEYPPGARIEGTVAVQFIIEHDGSTTNAGALSYPSEHLVKASLDSIAQWKFKPPTRDGQPARMQLEFHFEFRLRD